MKQAKKRKNQWFWFVGLYLLSLVVVAIVSYGGRWLVMG